MMSNTNHERCERYIIILGGVWHSVWHQTLEEYSPDRSSHARSQWSNGLCVHVQSTDSHGDTKPCCIVPDALATCIKHWLKYPYFADMTLQEYVDLILYKETPSVALKHINNK